MSRFILALDQGTTSTRALLFDRTMRPTLAAQLPLPQHFPHPGWVEHDLDDIWAAALAVLKAGVEKAGGPEAIAAIAITNQRETTCLWDRKTLRPLHRAIVWQDRRTADVCDALRRAGHEPEVQAATGLLLDPYFSATKIAWLLDHLPGARAAAEAGALAAGTIDSWLIARLTGGAVHATDASNASRTLLFDLAVGGWSSRLCALFGVPEALLPDVRDSAGDFGLTDQAAVGFVLPIRAVLGDQQAALLGQGCVQPGSAKCTYGTGAFLMVNTGAAPARSSHKLLSTVAWRLNGALTYAVEGAIFSAGATLQWLRDGLGLFVNTAESEAMAASLCDNGGVYLVPAFAGLGAPQWEAAARGAIVGLTRDSTRAHLARAGLEAAAYQTADLAEALAADGAGLSGPLRIDGGMTANAWFRQDLADMLDRPVQTPDHPEMTAAGAATAAALALGWHGSLEEAAAGWRAGLSAAPRLDGNVRARRMAGWKAAEAGVLAHARFGRA
jgi:glycerol kinase